MPRLDAKPIPLTEEAAERIASWWARGLPPEIRRGDPNEGTPVFESETVFIESLARHLTVQFYRILPGSREFGLVVRHARLECKIADQRVDRDRILRTLAEVMEFLNTPEMFPKIEPMIRRKRKSSLPRDRVVLTDVKNWRDRGKLPIGVPPGKTRMEVTTGMLIDWLNDLAGGHDPLERVEAWRANLIRLRINKDRTRSKERR